jgi:hypothetical protein
MEALWTAIADILWRIGEKSKCFVVLPQDFIHIPQSHKYLQDGITEKVITSSHRHIKHLVNISWNFKLSIMF